MQVRSSRVARQSLETYRRALCHPLSGLHERCREVSIQRVEAASVRDDDVIPVTAARASNEGNDAIIRRVHRRAERLDQVNACVEVRVAAVRGLEPEGAGTERLRDLGIRLGPDEAVLGRVAGTRRDLADAVGLQPQLQLRPY